MRSNIFLIWLSIFSKAQGMINFFSIFDQEMNLKLYKGFFLFGERKNFLTSFFSISINERNSFAECWSGFKKNLVWYWASIIKIHWQFWDELNNSFSILLILFPDISNLSKLITIDWNSSFNLKIMIIFI